MSSKPVSSNHQSKAAECSLKKKKKTVPERSGRWAYICNTALFRHWKKPVYVQKLANRNFKKYIETFESDINQLFFEGKVSVNQGSDKLEPRVAETLKHACTTQVSRNGVTSQTAGEVVNYCVFQKENSSMIASCSVHQTEILRYDEKENTHGLVSRKHFGHLKSVELPEQCQCKSKVSNSCRSHECGSIFGGTDASVENVCVTKSLSSRKSNCSEKEDCVSENSRLVLCKQDRDLNHGLGAQACGTVEKCKEPTFNEQDLQNSDQPRDCHCLNSDSSSKLTEQSPVVLVAHRKYMSKKRRQRLKGYLGTECKQSVEVQNDPKQALLSRHSMTNVCQAKENHFFFNNGQYLRRHQPSFPPALSMTNAGPFNQQLHPFSPMHEPFHPAWSNAAGLLGNNCYQHTAPALPHSFGPRADCMSRANCTPAHGFPVFNGALPNENLGGGMTNPHCRPALCVGGFNQQNIAQALLLEQTIKQILELAGFLPPNVGRF